MLWRRRHDEDEVDRVNRLWTVLILGIVGTSLVVYVAIFPDSAIACVPTSGEITPVAHANRLCLDQVYLASDDYYNYNNLFSYHSFVPMFLFLQILGFLFPHVVVQFLAGVLGKETELLFACAEVSKSSEIKDESFVTNKLKSPPKPSQVMTILYLIKKSLVLVNSFVQLVLIGIISGPDWYSYGSNTFPGFGYCTVKKQTFFCSLHINGICHKFYLCLFYWLLAVTLVNVASLVGWSLKLFLPRLTSKKIDMYTIPASNNENPEKTQKFLKEFVGRDYLLNLFLAESTVREITAADLTLQLWQSYESRMGTGVRNNGMEMNQM